MSEFVSSDLSSAVGIAIDDENNFFVANCGNNTIVKVIGLAGVVRKGA